MTPYNIVSFADFASFAAQQSGLLEALFRLHEQEFAESDLVVLVDDYRTKAAAVSISTPTVIRKLKELRVLEVANDLGPTYRYAQTLVDLHNHLAQASTPISPESIAGAIESLKKLVVELDEARAELSGSRTLSLAREIRQRCSQVLSGIEANYRHILSESANIRRDSRQMTAKERFQRLNRAWLTYIAPLAEILEVRGRIEAALLDAERAVQHSEDEGLFPDPGIAGLTLRQLLRLRERSIQRISDCTQQIRPLLERQRQESLAAEGAALAIDHLQKYGLQGSGIHNLLPIVWVAARDRYCDDQIFACARHAFGVVPRTPDPVALTLSPPPSLLADDDPAFLFEVVALVESTPRIDDLWGFLQARYPARPATHILAAFYYLLDQNHRTEIRFKPEIRRYEFDDGRLTAGVVTTAHE